MGNVLFAYGTLMFPEVFARVAGPPVLASSPCVLLGWRRHALRDATYPALVPCPGKRVQGVCYVEPATGQLQRLDAFEGDEYERVTLQQDGEDLLVYRWRDDPERLLAADWDVEGFRQTGLPSFQAGFSGWDR
ncbi:MAG: gamma-glutamylcyclotransferase family protein, partial [Planctomycetota bacterium]